MSGVAWQDQGECRDVRGFTEYPEERAVALCCRCSARSECLDYALSIHTLEQARALDGVVWGGRTGRELAALIRRRQRAAREQAVAA